MTARELTPERIAQLCEESASLHDRGYNCAQSVLLALAPLTGLTAQQAAKAMQSFGGGMGGLGEACGAFSGAIAALSLAADPLVPGDTAAKDAWYAKVKALGEAFRAAADALHCPELKPADPEARHAACSGYIRLAVKLAAEEMAK